MLLWKHCFERVNSVIEHSNGSLRVLLDWTPFLFILDFTLHVDVIFTQALYLFFQLHVNWSSFTGALQPAGNCSEVRCLWLLQLFRGWCFSGHSNPLGLFQHGVISKARHDPFLEARRLLMRNFIRKNRLKFFVLGARLIIYGSCLSQEYLAVLMSLAVFLWKNSRIVFFDACNHVSCCYCFILFMIFFS